MSKETFKAFARNHPELATSVLKNNTTWQKLYDIYLFLLYICEYFIYMYLKNKYN